VKQALLDSGLTRLTDRFDYVHVFGTKGNPPEQIVERLGKTFDHIPQGKPFFLYFGFNQTHRPFITDHRDIDSGKLAIPKDWPDCPPCARITPICSPTFATWTVSLARSWRC
jgi:hypothetical protein